MGKAKTFLEVFISSLNEDFRFPILEIFAAIHIIGIFILLYSITAGGPGGQAGRFYQTLQLGSLQEIQSAIVSSLTGVSTFAFQMPIFGMLILKNIAYSFGNDLERGTVQNLLSYPLKRRWLLTAKLLSSIVVVYLLSLGISILELYVIVPNVVSQNFAFIFVSFFASLSFPLLVASLVLLFTLVLKRGSIALFAGIGLYFASAIIVFFLMFSSTSSGSPSEIPIKIACFICPGLALQAFYTLDPSVNIAKSVIGDPLIYVGAGYTLAILVLALVYFYFERRLQI